MHVTLLGSVARRSGLPRSSRLPRMAAGWHPPAALFAVGLIYLRLQVPHGEVLISGRGLATAQRIPSPP
eukprot:2381033-Pyramimonas_sp.AAC.1